MDNNNLKNPREIDVLAGDVESWWGKTFTYVKKTEINTWKGALLVAFFAGLAVALIWTVKADLYSFSSAAAESALYFNPDTTNVTVGSNFDLVATIDPGTNLVRAVELHVTYDETKLTLNGITCSSVFSTQIADPVIPGDGTAAAYCGSLSNPVTATSAVATFSFTATAPASNLTVAFMEDSAAAADGEGENDAIATMTNATVTITGVDTTAPEVTAFEIPSTHDSLIIPITTFTATDDTGVTGYVVTETPGSPNADDGRWSATAPENYTFSSPGYKTLYAWAKDAAGNVSESLNDSVTITLADTTPPTVTAFEIPSTSESLEVEVTTFTATDDTGVTGYIITESSSTPAAGSPGWSDTAPISYTFSSPGSKTLYAWAKDAAGNVSESLNDSVTITLADTTPPTVTAFNIPSTSELLLVPITTFTATDNVGVTGYMVTESSTAPSAADEDWLGEAPEDYIFSSPGSKTLYAWAKDAAGNVSASRSDSVVITLPATNNSAPVVSNLSPSDKFSAGTKSTTLRATTNKDATCKFSGSSSTSFDDMATFSNTGGTSHSHVISGLADNTRYRYYVRCSDGSGNISQIGPMIDFAVHKKGSEDSKDKKKAETKPRTIKNSPSKVARGATLRQYGKKFSKNSTVLLYFSKYGGGYYAPVPIKTDSHGKFTILYRVTKPQGTYSWYAVDTKTGKKSRTIYYKVK